MSRLTLRRWSWLPLLVACWLPFQGAWAALEGICDSGRGPALVPAPSMDRCPDGTAGDHDAAALADCHHAGPCDPDHCDACGHCIHGASLLPPTVSDGFAGLPGNARPGQAEGVFPIRYPASFDRPPPIS